MKHRELDLLPAYFLGALAPRERARMERHLAKGCRHCEARAAAYGRVAAALPMATLQRSPRPELKAALLARLGPEPAPRRFLWRWPVLAPFAGALAACAALAWFAWAPRAPQAAAEAPAALRLSLRSGALTQAGHAVLPGEALAWDAVLATAAGGQAQVQVGGQAVLLLKPGTQLRLTRDGAAVRAELPHGTLFSAVLPGTAFSVRAGGAQVDAHGTLFLVRHVDEGRAYVCICRGSIQVRAPGLDRLLASADDAHESGLNLVLGPTATTAAVAKPAYYTDAEEDGLKDALRAAAGGHAPKEDDDD